MVNTHRGNNKEPFRETTGNSHLTVAGCFSWAGSAPKGYNDRSLLQTGAPILSSLATRRRNSSLDENSA